MIQKKTDSSKTNSWGECGAGGGDNTGTVIMQPQQGLWTRPGYSLNSGGCCVRLQLTCSWRVERDAQEQPSFHHTQEPLDTSIQGAIDQRDGEPWVGDALQPIKVANRNRVVKNTKTWSRGRWLWEKINYDLDREGKNLTHKEKEILWLGCRLQIFLWDRDCLSWSHKKTCIHL